MVGDRTTTCIDLMPCGYIEMNIGTLIYIDISIFDSKNISNVNIVYIA